MDHYRYFYSIVYLAFKSMNERIRELMAEADRKCSETRGIYDEILAQLIIEECARESDKQTIYCRGIPWGKWIKDHFEIL